MGWSRDLFQSVFGKWKRYNCRKNRHSTAQVAYDAINWLEKIVIKVNLLC